MNQLPLPSVNLRFLKSCLNYIDGVRKTLYLDNIMTTIYAFGYMMVPLYSYSVQFVPANVQEAVS